LLWLNLLILYFISLLRTLKSTINLDRLLYKDTQARSEFCRSRISNLIKSLCWIICDLRCLETFSELIILSMIRNTNSSYMKSLNTLNDKDIQNADYYYRARDLCLITIILMLTSDDFCWLNFSVSIAWSDLQDSIHLVIFISISSALVLFFCLFEIFTW